MLTYRHALVDVLEVLDNLEDMITNVVHEDGTPLDDFDLGYLEALDAVKEDVMTFMYDPLGEENV